MASVDHEEHPSIPASEGQSTARPDAILVDQPPDDQDDDPPSPSRLREEEKTLLPLFQALLSVIQCYELMLQKIISENEEEEHQMEEYIMSFLPALQAAAAAAAATAAAADPGAAAGKRRRVHQSDAVDRVSWYVRPRSSVNWWNHYVNYAHVGDERFREVFRLPPELFFHITALLRDDLEQGQIPNSLRRVPGRIFSVERKVAIAILRLSSGMRQVDVSEHFGCGRSTVSNIVNQFVMALKKRGYYMLQWPETDKALNEVKDGFQALRGLPNCCGAIGCTHFPINLPPGQSSEDWLDRWGNYSMIMQAIVDANMRFLNVNVGWPGKHTCRSVLQSSSFNKLCQEHQRLSGPPFHCGDLQIREYVVGDGGYPLLPWLMTPFLRDQLTSTDRKDYNVIHLSTRMVVEQAFTRLKGTWLYLGRTINSPNIGCLPHIIHACCILHNMLVEYDEGMDEMATIDVHDPMVNNPPHDPYYPLEEEELMEGECMRAAVMEYILLQNGPGP